MSKDMNDQIQLAHKVVKVMDRKIYVTLLRYNVDKFEISYAQVPFFANNQEDEKFEQVVYVNYKLEEFIYLFAVMNFVYDKVITNQFPCNALLKVISSVYPSLLFFLFEWRWVGTLEIIETSFSS